MTDVDAAEWLADNGFHVEGAWRHGTRWSVRVTSDIEADHDSYENGGGDSLVAALADAAGRIKEWLG